MTTQTTDERATIREFLALPTSAMTSADYVSSADGSSADAWTALRSADIDAPIRVRAERDGWRDGVIIGAAR